MSDKDKELEKFDKNSDEIVEETMQEIFEELHTFDDLEEVVQDETDYEDEMEETEAEEDLGGSTAENSEIYDDDDFEELEYQLEEDEEEAEVDDDEEFETEKDYDSELKAHRKKKKIILIIAAAVGVLVAAYLGVGLFFNSHFFFQTKINGTDFSAKSVAQVEAYMEQQVSSYKLELKEADGGSEVISGADIGLEYVKGDEIDKLVKEQNALLWITAFFNRPEIHAPVGVDYDEEKLKQVMADLNCMKPEEQTPSVSAVPEFRNTAFEIKSEVQGTQIDTEKFEKAVSTAIREYADTLDMTKSDCYVKPKFTSQSAEVIAAKDAMNKYMGATVTYNFTPHTEVVDAAMISQWVTVDENMAVTFNQDAVMTYIQSLADKYDTYGKSRMFTTANGNTVEVTGGKYGWLLDVEGEYAALIANIQNAEVVTREPMYASAAVSHEGNDFGNTYAEIDLTGQHMWYFQNGQLVMETDIVTGNPNKGNGTPQGTYSLAYKARDQVLRGKKLPGGGYEYESPVDFWMPFNGGIGFHDATWQSAFGGSRYQTAGSHGCVNMPYEAAQKLFGLIEAGIPVICHY